jgi:hypothetical protein
MQIRVASKPQASKELGQTQKKAGCEKEKKINKIEAMPAWNFCIPSGRLTSPGLRCNSIK